MCVWFLVLLGRGQGEGNSTEACVRAWGEKECPVPPQVSLVSLELETLHCPPASQSQQHPLRLTHFYTSNCSPCVLHDKTLYKLIQVEGFPHLYIP